MKAVFVLFDTLNRRFLPPYGATWQHAPNFSRLAERSVTFDRCYAGSMPCMPARRELHTGRYNFLHRSWGPLEPFDDSVPEILGRHGVYTHLVTDHQHYWEDGGATYHNRFRTYEFFRGQEGDAWKGHVADPPQPPGSTRRVRHNLWRQDIINRQYLQDVRDHPQTLTVDAGIGFIRTNSAEDRWFVQIECFDPHEPFFTYPEYQRLAPEAGAGSDDWPDYRRVDDSHGAVEAIRAEYSALLSMCDASLGRILDTFDELDLWGDTMLIVGTDHGFLLGEHGWWGKNVQPWYEENIHTPLFVWDPRSGIAGHRREGLVQTVDLGPTLLDFFEVEPTPRMQGRTIAPLVAEDGPGRPWALFGAFGAHVNITDGRYVYMRSCVDDSNAPLEEHTLMPTHMSQRFTPEELRDAELVGPLPFTQGVRVLRMPGHPFGSPSRFGTVLFDLDSDPEQRHPILDEDLELRMLEMLLQALRESDAPTSQYERLGLPATGPASRAHLLAAAQHERYRESLQPLPTASDLPEGSAVVDRTLAELAAEPAFVPMLSATLGPVLEWLVSVAGSSTLLELAPLSPTLSLDALRKLDEQFRSTVGEETTFPRR